MSARILIVDDEQAIRESLRGLFEDEGYTVDCAASGEEAVARFRKQPADCVLLDIWMPGIDGLETLTRLQQIDPEVPVIMMSGHATIDTAVRATRQGAFDFVEKPLSSDRLLILVRNASEKRKLRTENIELKNHLQDQVRYDLVGSSPAINEVRNLIKRIAATDTPVLITGEHGVGKAVAARLIHQQSKRAGGAFVEVKTAAIAGARADCELFGYEKGAFAGALQAQRGRFEAANGGSLYIDEVAELSTAVQAKILRVLKERSVQRLGASRPVAVNVRLLAATASDPEEAVRTGRMREDFYQRLNVVSLHIPPLRERSEDIPALAEALAAEQAVQLGGKPVSFTAEAMAMLQGYSWPGNVRELRNYIERCHILAAGKQLDVCDMPPLTADTVAGGDLAQRFHAAREAFEKNYLLYHLNKHGWNISHTAEDIGMERSQLHRKIKSYGLAPPKREEA